jgi:uncharacterized protein (TIGR02145 family)
MDKLYELERKYFDSIVLGDQIWMTRNLDVVHFRNGDLITEVKDNREWVQADKDGMPAWCYYNNDHSIGPFYGKLYNFHAVYDDRGLAPEGWVIPTASQFNKLMLFLEPNWLQSAELFSNSVGDNFSDDLSGDWKEPGDDKFPIWKTGLRQPDGAFQFLDVLCEYWTSSFAIDWDMWSFSEYGPGFGYRNAGGGSNYGLPVRCLRG